MRGRKTQIYDGGHRVPCFVRWPAGGLRPPGDVNTPAQMQDVLPTLIDLCGLKDRRGAQFDGASLAGLLKDAKAALPDRMLVVQYGQILKKWDSCTIWGKWRLVSGGELYDIHADPGQKNDVAAQNAGVVKKMRDHYEAWWGARRAGTARVPAPQHRLRTRESGGAVILGLAGCLLRQRQLDSERRGRSSGRSVESVGGAGR